MPKRDKHSAEERCNCLKHLVDVYESALLRYVSRLMGNPSFSEDIVQNTFIKLIHQWDGELVPSPALSSWLYRVAHNETVDQIRRESKRKALHAEHGQSDPSERPYQVPPGETGLSDRAESAAEALEKLSDRERQLVVLKVYEEKSYKEIAEITGLTTGNVGFILHTAMKKLAAMLAKGGSR